MRYNDTEYFRAVLSTAPSKPKEKPILKPPKQPVIYPHQFFPPKLYVLLERQLEAYKKKLVALQKKKGRE